MKQHGQRRTEDSRKAVALLSPWPAPPFNTVIPWKAKTIRSFSFPEGKLCVGSKTTGNARPRKWCFGKQQEERGQLLVVGNHLARGRRPGSRDDKSSWPCSPVWGPWEIRKAGHFIY